MIRSLGHRDIGNRSFIPNHRAVGVAALDAIYVRATAPLYYPAHASGGLAPHGVGEPM
jgi:hypothetical protein